MWPMRNVITSYSIHYTKLYDRPHGWLFDPGYGKLNQELETAGRRVCFRIGHMGDVNEKMLADYLAALSDILAAS